MVDGHDSITVELEYGDGFREGFIQGFMSGLVSGDLGPCDNVNCPKELGETGSCDRDDCNRKE